MRRSYLQRHTPLRRRGKTAAKRRRRNFASQAALCRSLPCWNCGAPPPSEPHHTPSQSAGGTDKDTIPTCRACHDDWHHGSGPWLTRAEAEAAKVQIREGLA